MKEKNLQIKSEIHAELKQINSLLQEMKEYITQNEKPMRRAKGSVLHDFYNACERIFKLIAVGLNGGFLFNLEWHKKLLYQMTIPIENIRPSVISENLASELNDFLSFRHLFRNIYGFELKSDRLDKLVIKFEKIALDFQKEIENFIKKL